MMSRSYIKILFHLASFSDKLYLRNDNTWKKVKNMLFEEEYNYTLIDQIGYDMQYLEAKCDGLSIKRYIKIFYRNNEEIKSKEVYDWKEPKKTDDIIVKYYIEELDMTNSPCHSMYKLSKCYKIQGIGFFKKWISIFEDYEEDEVIENSKVNELIRKYDLDFKDNIDDKEFLKN